VILTASDQANYFPNVSQTGAALDGLLHFAQATCEGSYGSNRLLELQQFTHILTVNTVFYTATIPLMPIASSPLPTLETRVHRKHLNGYTLSDWQAVNQFTIDYEIGQLNLGLPATEAKLTYRAGFDFSIDTPEVRSIKAIAGVIVDWAAHRFYGQLDSYLLNPAGNSDVTSWNTVPLDRWLQVILMPLKKYVPRGSGG